MLGLSHRDIESSDTNWPFFFESADNIFTWEGDFYGDPRNFTLTTRFDF